MVHIKSQFTINAQNVLHLNPCTHGHVWSWTVAPFQRSRGSCEWFDRHQNCAGEVSLHFKLKLNTLGVLVSPRIKVYRRKWGMYLEKVCRHIMIWTFSLVLLWEIHFWSLSKHFGCTLCTVKCYSVSHKNARLVLTAMQRI